MDAFKGKAFRDKSEQRVRLKLCVHFDLIAIARMFKNGRDGPLDGVHERDLREMSMKFANAPATLAGSPNDMSWRKRRHLAAP
ncbi:MAG: hypothetical protein OXH76_06970 [Boseongicola sp.]|nr:hypothetical protein [Boseongicola sp.]